MKLLMKIFVVCILIVIFHSPLKAATIVKDDLKEVSSEKKDLVFASFAQVPLYYLGFKGGGTSMSMYEDDPEMLPGLLPKAPEGFVITLYYDIQMAEQMKSVGKGNEDEDSYEIRETTLGTILNGQYSRIDMPPSIDPQKPDPDFLVVDNPFKMAIFPEYLMSVETGEPFVAEDQGFKFIPAFIANNIPAIQFQESLGGEEEYTRVGQDFKSFLKFVEEYADSETPVVVFSGLEKQ